MNRRKFLTYTTVSFATLSAGSYYSKGKFPKWVKNTKMYFDYYTQALVLMYHRVENTKIDPWGLSVSPENFESQLMILKETGLVRHINDLGENIYSNKTIKPAIIITFDDGYIDNYTNAMPLLEKYELPATFFISTLNIDKQKGFWWDELMDIILSSQELPSRIKFEWGQGRIDFELAGEESLTDEINHKHELWDGSMPPPTLRAELYMELWELISTLKFVEQQIVMDELRRFLGKEPGFNHKNYSMSQDQLIELGSSNLFTLGGHTTTHPILTAHFREYQREEIKKNKEFLESLTKKKVETFSFPHGKFNDETIAELKDLGFKTAFTTNGKSVEKIGENPFLIGRYQVNNLPKEKFYSTLESWLI
jgi:peptidoglycan/xylan/chitin deacetylase (PgdA/CDA1 family)